MHVMLSLDAGPGLAGGPAEALVGPLVISLFFAHFFLGLLVLPSITIKACLFAPLIRLLRYILRRCFCCCKEEEEELEGKAAPQPADDVNVEMEGLKAIAARSR